MKNSVMSPQKLVRLALFVALVILLQNYLGIHTDFIKIGFSFVPIALCAMLYGPVWAGVVAAVADVLGWVLYPIGGFFPGLTVVAAINGVVFGLLLYRRSNKWWPVIVAVAINQLFTSLIVNTFFLSILYHTPFLALLPTRIAQVCIMIPIQIVVLRLLNNHRLLHLIDAKAIA